MVAKNPLKGLLPEKGILEIFVYRLVKWGRFALIMNLKGYVHANKGSGSTLI